MHVLNMVILVYIYSFFVNNFWKDFSHIFSDWPIFFLPLFLVWAWLFWTYKVKNDDKKSDLLYIFYSVIFAVAWNLIIQQFFHTDRPEWSCSIDGSTIIKHIPDASFPSDHAVVSFSFLAALYLAGYKKTALAFFPFVIAMNLSRIMVCVHWPFDILMWACLWIFWAFFTFKLIKKISFFEKLNSFIIKMMNKIKL